VDDRYAQTGSACTDHVDITQAVVVVLDIEQRFDAEGKRNKVDYKQRQTSIATYPALVQATPAQKHKPELIILVDGNEDDSLYQLHRLQRPSAS